MPQETSVGQDQLFLLGGREVRLPCRVLPAGRRGDDLGLLFFWLLGFAITPLLAFGHLGLLGLHFALVKFVGQQHPPVRRAYPFHVALPQKPLGLLQRDCYRAAANIQAAVFIGRADREGRMAFSTHATR
jgi:hypothetical protein